MERNKIGLLMLTLIFFETTDATLTSKKSNVSHTIFYIYCHNFMGGEKSRDNNDFILKWDRERNLIQ